MSEATEKLVSLELEKTFINGLFRNPSVIFKTDSFLKEGDFHNKLNQTIFIVCRDIILKGGELSKTLVAQKVKELNISFKDPISPFDYIDAITMSPVSEGATENAAKELVKLRIRRDIYEDTNDVRSYILGPECSKSTVAKMISDVDLIYNKRINAVTTDDEPIDLYAGIIDLINDRAANQLKEVGLITPFNIFNQYFGGIRSKNGIYNIISRSGEGKSTFLFNMAKGIALLNNCPVLYLDTEMSLELNQWRAVAAESIVNPWFLETGKWAGNKNLIEKVQKSFPKLKQYEGKIYHKTCPNMGIAEMLGVIRKWYFKYVGRGNKCLVVYDYLKVTSDIDKNRQEWQQLGDKVSALNQIGYDHDIHIWSAGQQNRTAQQNGQRVDDSTTVGASDRINQYAAFNAIFREKTLEEVTDHGLSYGTHLMKPIKVSRTQGEDNYFKNNKVRIVDEHRNKVVYEQNFINYLIDEFNVSEKGTYKDIIKSQNLKKDLVNDKKNYELDDVDL